jgi:hypothetical protein
VNSNGPMRSVAGVTPIRTACSVSMVSNQSRRQELWKTGKQRAMTEPDDEHPGLKLYLFLGIWAWRKRGDVDARYRCSTRS